MRTRLHTAVYLLSIGATGCSAPEPAQGLLGRTTQDVLIENCEYPFPAPSGTTHRPVKIIIKDKPPSGVAAKRIPCVQIKSYITGNLRYQTDANGEAVIYEPGVMRGWFSFELSHPDASQSEALFPPAWGPTHYHVPMKEGGVCTIEAATAYTNVDCEEGALQGPLGDIPVPYGSQRFHVRIVAGNASGPPIPGAKLTIAPQTDVEDDPATDVTDSTGKAAIYRPGMMNTQRTFRIESPGYHPLDRALTLTPGQSPVVVPLQPLDDQVARRLYKLTGLGIKREEHLLGTGTVTDPPDKNLVNGDVLGQDGPHATLFNGQVYWTFGDTHHPNLDFKNLEGSGATSSATFSATGLPLTYYKTSTAEVWPFPGVHLFPKEDGIVTADQFASPLNAQGNPIEVARWPFGLSTIKTGSVEELVTYVTVIDNSFKVYYIGIGVYSDAPAEKRFLYYGKLPAARDHLTNAVTNLTLPGEHVYKVTERLASTPPTEQEYLHSGTFNETTKIEGYVRVPAIKDDLDDKLKYQEYTPFDANGVVNRTATRVFYSWQPQIDEGSLPADESLGGQMRVLASDGSSRAVKQAKTSRQFNHYRKRYVNIFNEDKGPGDFFLDRSKDNLFYSEGDTPVGPWFYARRIVDQDGSYDLYNAHQLPFYAVQDKIYFAAVFGTSVGHWQPIPYYDYNIVMNELPLASTKTAVPVPVYELGGSTSISYTLGTKRDVHGSALPELPVPFFAYDRSLGTSTRAAYWSDAQCRPQRRLNMYAPGAEPANQIEADFHVLAPGVSPVPADTVPLYEYRHSIFTTVSFVGTVPAPEHFTRTGPIGHVFKNPAPKVWIPAAQYLGDLHADAGVDLCLSAPQPGLPAPVPLNASGSKSRVGDAIVNYKWETATTVLFNGNNATPPNITLPAGKHFIRLTVTTASNKTATDKLIVDVAPTVELTSIAAEDGKIFGCTTANTSGCNMDVGNSTATALQVGDTTGRLAARSILSFDTTPLDAKAIVQAASLVLTRGSTSGTPFDDLRIDIATAFHTSALLQNEDFQSAPHGGSDNVGLLTRVGTTSTFTGALMSHLEVVHNSTRKTQFRVRAGMSSDGDAAADLHNFFSGNNGTAANRPKLRVSYFLCTECP